MTCQRRTPGLTLIRTCNVRKMTMSDTTVPAPFASKSDSTPFNSMPGLKLTAIQSSASNIIEFTPPRKIPLPNQILEQEPYREP